MRCVLLLLVPAVAACGASDSGSSSESPPTAASVDAGTDGAVPCSNCGSWVPTSGIDGTHEVKDVVSTGPAAVPYPACADGITDICVVSDEVTMFARPAPNNDLGGATIGQVFVDDTSVYWIEKRTGFRARRVAKSQASATSTVATGATATLDAALGGGRLFWVTPGGIQAVDIEGGAPEVVYISNGVRDIFFDATSLVAVSGATLVTMSVAGSVTSTIPADNCVSPAADAVSFYCHDATGIVRKFPKDGSAAAVLGNSATGLLARFGSKLYVESRVAGIEQLVTMSLEGGEPGLVMTASGKESYADLVPFDDSLYVARQSGSIDRIHADGTRTSLSPATFRPPHIAVDGTGVYWVSTRSYCLLLHVDVTTGRYASDKSECRDGRDETVVLRAGRSF